MRRGWTLTLPRPGFPVGRMAQRGGEVAPAGIQPDAVAGLTGWWRGDGPLWTDSGRTVAAVNADDLIYTWDDKSGNARHMTQATSGARPKLKLAIVNGLPVVRFDGVDDLLGGVAYSNFVTNTTYCAYTVFNASVVNSDLGVGSIRNNDPTWSSAPTAYLGQVLRSSGTVWAQNYAGAEEAVSLAHTAGTWYAVRQRHAGGRLYLMRSGGGTEVSIVSANTANLSFPMQFGKSPSNWLQGDLAEIFFYNVDPSAGDQAGIEAYLSSRYGLTW